MPPEAAAATVTVRYWAGARAAAGVDSDTISGVATVGDAVAAVTRLRPALEPVTAVSSLLVGGVPADRDAVLPAGAVVEVLPPFAGG
jgi:molybdopterin converting factor small subunit